MTAPLVFLPGWCVGRGPLNAAVNAQNGLVFDLPGYRDAPLISDFYAAADDLASRLQPGTTLVGWSLGAQLAIAIAARAPEKVGKLVLIAGTTSFIQRDGWPTTRGHADWAAAAGNLPPPDASAPAACPAARSGANQAPAGGGQAGA